jgi:hypothetical protein
MPVYVGDKACITGLLFCHKKNNRLVCKLRNKNNTFANHFFG